MDKGILIGISFIAGFVTALLFVAVGSVIAFTFFMNEGAVLQPNLEYPTTIESGSTLELVVHLVNEEDEQIVLDSIDVDDSLLAGFKVIDTVPMYGEQSDLYEMETFDFGFSVEAGATTAVVFRLEALEPGRYSGELEIRNANQDFIAEVAVIDVIAPAGE